MTDHIPVSLRYLPVAGFSAGLLGLLFYSLLGSFWATVPAVGLGIALTHLLEDHLSGRGRLQVKRALVYGGAGAVGMALAALILH